jgi:hypothetical protein
MKKYHANRRGERGNTLLLTIVVTGLIGFLLAAYLTLVQNQNQANVRSQSWNSAMPVVEAGIEEALQHLNKNGATNGSLATDGWAGGGSVYSVTRTLGNALYSVTIRNYYPGTTTNTPLIESKGYVVMPLVLASAQGALLATANGGQSTINYLGRGVRVQTGQDFIFSKGMVARDLIDLNGNNIRSDSFDSTDPRYSTNGMYYSGWARDNGDIAVNSSLTNSLNAGNANIYGHVAVGPSGTIAVGTGGSIGSTAWHQSGAGGVESGWSKNDMNVSFPDVTAPWSGGAFTPSGGWITNSTSTVSSSTNSVTTYAFPAGCGGSVSTNTLTSTIFPLGHPGPVTTLFNAGGKVIGYTYAVFVCSSTTSTTNTTYTATYYDYILDSGNYQLSDLTGTVYVRGKANLYVTTTLDITSLIIKTGESLALYCGAASASLAGNSTVNSDGTANNFSFWGLPTCTSVTFSGNSGFTGTIYAPNADFTMNGSGNTTFIDFTGASITKTSTLNGHFNFHYDEALRKFGPFRGYIVSSWNEMNPSEVPQLSVAGGSTSSGGTSGQ